MRERGWLGPAAGGPPSGRGAGERIPRSPRKTRGRLPSAARPLGLSKNSPLLLKAEFGWTRSSSHGNACGGTPVPYSQRHPILSTACGNQALTGTSRRQSLSGRTGSNLSPKTCL